MNTYLALSSIFAGVAIVPLVNAAKKRIQKDLHVFLTTLGFCVVLGVLIVLFLYQHVNLGSASDVAAWIFLSSQIAFWLLKTLEKWAEQPDPVTPQEVLQDTETTATEIEKDVQGTQMVAPEASTTAA